MDGAVIVLEREGKFLLQLRSNVEGIPNPNKWGFFGGCIEEGENPQDTIVREIKEELNINLEKDKLNLITSGKLEHRKIHVFEHPCKWDKKDMKLGEGQDFNFFSAKEIFNIKNTAPGLRNFVKEFLVN